MAVLTNPVLAGFHPDPSFLCVGQDWYLATSTFEWWPGVQLFHSRDLANWERLPAPLTRKSQLDLTGVADSGGVWAPNLSYCDGKFYLIYSNVHNFGGTFYDVDNYLVTAEDIHGPWSKPVFLNSSGFDPSLFHAPDGRKYLLNMAAEYRTWKVRFAGIMMQEYSEAEQKVIGEPKMIWRGSSSRTTEGPVMYYKDGWYYLFCAEGGTGVRHCEVVLRSRQIYGPYERGSYEPLITAWPYPANPLQKAGHASMAQGPDGSWFLAHLCSRPVGPEKDCILGRETAIQPLEWRDGWPCLCGGTDEPRLTVQTPYAESPVPADRAEGMDWTDEFDGAMWNERLQSLRMPLENRASLQARPGWLRLYGAQSLESRFAQSLLAARQQHLHSRVETRLDFDPVDYHHTAGLVYYYDNNSHYYLALTRDERQGKVLTVMRRRLKQFDMPIGAGVPVPDGPLTLRLETNGATAQFYWSADGENFAAIGPELDATLLSDDAPERILHENRFTGAFVGICCQDLTGQKRPADFDFYRYTSLETV